MITEEQLKQFEKLLEGTTPGEWTTRQTKHLFGDGSPVFEVLSKTNHKGITRQDGGWYVIGELFGDTDATFTAVARNGFKQLIDAYREQQRQLAECRAALEWALARADSDPNISSDSAYYKALQSAVGNERADNDA